MDIKEEKLRNRRDASDNECNLDAQEYKIIKKKKGRIENMRMIGFHAKQAVIPECKRNSWKIQQCIRLAHNSEKNIE